MKRFLTLALVGALALGASSFVYANVCAFDAAPASTLLFPFVNYNYELGSNGGTTIWSITNVSSEAQIVHITVWTDFSVAILDFNILLTGYDVVRVNMRDILRDGQLPVTLVEDHDDDEGAVEDGPVSEDNTFTPADPPDMAQPEETTVLEDDGRCDENDSAYPGKFEDPIPPNFLALFQGWLQSSQTVDRFHDNCTDFPDPEDSFVPAPTPWFESRDTDDDTWMYITADVVETCNKTFPDELGYFNTEIRYDNVLIGDAVWVDNAARFSEADQAVHLEASFDLDQFATQNWFAPLFPISFYSRYANDPSLDFTSDLREPLPTAWAIRYDSRTNLGLSTRVRAWKGGSNPAFKVVPDLSVQPEVDESPSELIAFNCLAYTYYTWDLDENVTSIATVPWSQPGGEDVIINLLPLETQEVDATQFNLVDQEGWMLFIWPWSNFAATNYDHYQTWMGAKYIKEGDFSAALSGAVMANYNCFDDQVLPGLGINYAY